jgi:N-methylhydantoinase B
VEVTEVRFPLFFRTHEFRPDSGGDGRYRGGAGSVLELVAEIAEPARANTAGDGVRHPPYGILGGRDGLPHRYRLRSRGRPDRVLKTKEVGVVVRPGDVFLVESGGGGGYGDPRKREAAARERDVANGVVTRRPRARKGR